MAQPQSRKVPRSFYSTSQENQNKIGLMCFRSMELTHPWVFCFFFVFMKDNSISLMRDDEFKISFPPLLRKSNLWKNETWDETFSNCAIFNLCFGQRFRYYFVVLMYEYLSLALSGFSLHTKSENQCYRAKFFHLTLVPTSVLFIGAGKRLQNKLGKLKK